MYYSNKVTVVTHISDWTDLQKVMGIWALLLASQAHMAMTSSLVLLTWELLPQAARRYCRFSLQAHSIKLSFPFICFNSKPLNMFLLQHTKSQTQFSPQTGRWRNSNSWQRSELGSKVKDGVNYHHLAAETNICKINSLQNKNKPETELRVYLQYCLENQFKVTSEGQTDATFDLSHS